MTTRKKPIIFKEVPIFPMACEKGHNFSPLRKDCTTGDIDGYYKKDGNNNQLKDHVYCMLLCNQCGSTKEIIMVSYRRD